jgi:large conductance mechanosensitive channel
MSMIQEFKAFAMKGNVLDLAIGVIIGGAFGTIVNSLVGDIFMPVIGILTGGINFSGLSLNVGDAAIAYGKFLQAVFVFLITAWALFMVVKAANAMKEAGGGKTCRASCTIPGSRPPERNSRRAEGAVGFASAVQIHIYRSINYYENESFHLRTLREFSFECRSPDRYDRNIRMETHDDRGIEPEPDFLHELVRRRR